MKNEHHKILIYVNKNNIHHEAAEHKNCYPSIINTLHFNNVKEYLNLLYVKEQTEYVKIIEN